MLVVDAKKMKMARLNKGFSQAVLAQEAGVAMLTINLLEAQKTKCPHPSTIKKICDVLGVSPYEVYTNL